MGIDEGFAEEAVSSGAKLIKRLAFMDLVKLVVIICSLLGAWYELREEIHADREIFRGELAVYNQRMADLDQTMKDFKGDFNDWRREINRQIWEQNHR